MGEVEEVMEKLLRGEGLEVSALDVVPEQAKAVVLRKTVSYIVCAVIFNDKDEVLMVQEAKQDCYKQWYLPAGRMEAEESIEDALKREVKEEAGFDCQPITLLLVQEQGPQWIRFVFLAEVTGGSLKSPEQADQESLQAAWWNRDSPLTLRGRDIVRLIEAGLKYRQSPGHAVTRPLDMPCQHVVQRSILTFTNTEDQVWVLLVKDPSPHLPAAAAVRTHAVTWAANMVVQAATPSAYYDYEVNTLGIVSLQHSAQRAGGSDGVCFNCLVALVPDPPQWNEEGNRVKCTGTGQPPAVENPRYHWHKVQDQVLRQRLLDLTRNVAILPVYSLY